jgi:hypothetical protein
VLHNRGLGETMMKNYRKSFSFKDKEIYSDYQNYLFIPIQEQIYPKKSFHRCRSRSISPESVDTLDQSLKELLYLFDIMFKKIKIRHCSIFFSLNIN